MKKKITIISILVIPFILLLYVFSVADASELIGAEATPQLKVSSDGSSISQGKKQDFSRVIPCTGYKPV